MSEQNDEFVKSENLCQEEETEFLMNLGAKFIQSMTFSSRGMASV